MRLKYTGLTMDRLYDGMTVNVPTDWETSAIGHVIEYAWDEISDALHRRGIYLSERELRCVFSTYPGGNDFFYNFWEKA